MKLLVSLTMLCLVLFSTSTTYGGDKKKKAKAEAAQKEECSCQDEEKLTKKGKEGSMEMEPTVALRSCAIFPLYPLEPDENGNERYLYYALLYETCPDPDPQPDYLVGLYYWEAACDSGYCVEGNLLLKDSKDRTSFPGMKAKVSGDLSFQILDRNGVQERDFEIPKGPARKSSVRANPHIRYLKFQPGGGAMRYFQLWGIDRATKHDKGGETEDEDDIIYVAYEMEKENPPQELTAQPTFSESIGGNKFAYRAQVIVDKKVIGQPDPGPVWVLVLLAE